GPDRTAICATARLNSLLSVTDAQAVLSTGEACDTPPHRDSQASGASGDSGASGSSSVRISIFQPVSFAASRAFWPSLPMARENWFSGTTARTARPTSSITTTLLTLDGDSALVTNAAGSSSK